MATQMSAYVSLSQNQTGIRVVVCEPDAALRSQLRAVIDSDPLLILSAEARDWAQCQASLDDCVPELLLARSDLIPSTWCSRVDRTFLPVVIALRPAMSFPHPGRRYTDLRVPAAPQALKAALDRAVGEVYERKAKELLFLVDRYVTGSQHATTYKTAITVEHEGKSLSLSTDEIVSVVAARKHVEIRSPQGEFLLREPIHEVAEQLDPRCFVRIHRSVIVNLRHICETGTPEDKPAVVCMADGSRYAVGPNYREALAEALRDSYQGPTSVVP